MEILIGLNLFQGLKVGTKRIHEFIVWARLMIRGREKSRTGSVNSRKFRDGANLSFFFHFFFSKNTRKGHFSIKTAQKIILKSKGNEKDHS